MHENASTNVSSIANPPEKKIHLIPASTHQVHTIMIPLLEFRVQNISNYYYNSGQNLGSVCAS